MRIAQCLEYPIQQHGGTEVLVRELIGGLAPRHEILLVSNDDESSWRSSSVASQVTCHLRWDPQGVTPARSRELAAALAEKQVELAHFHFGGTFGWGSRRAGFAPAIHLSRRGVPCLATNHGVFDLLDGYIGPQRSLMTKLALLPLAWASRLQLIWHLRAEVAVSMNDYRALRRRFWPLRGRFRQIYHSQLHGPPPALNSERTKTILCLGSIGARKGQWFLVEAFCRIASQHPGWHLVIAGRHADREITQRIQSLVAASGLGERIAMPEEVSDAEAHGLLHSAAIFVMPSLMEGLGLSLQEAQFYGCACIASRAGGMQDLIQHEDNGLLVPPADAGQLAAALDRLIRDEALRRRFAGRGPKSVLEKGMTAGTMVEKYESLYAEVVAGGRA